MSQKIEKENNEERLARARHIRAKQKALHEPVKASKWIDPLDLDSSTPVVLCCRTPNSRPFPYASLEDQAAKLRTVLEVYGGHLIGTVTHVGWSRDPSWLKEAVNIGKSFGACGVTLLAESTIPFIVNSDIEDEQQTLFEFKKLAEATKGCRLMTVLHPDAPFEEALAYLRKSGQATKRRLAATKKFPAYLQEERLEMLRKILELKAQHRPYDWIAYKLGVPSKQVEKWFGAFPSKMYREW